MLTLSWSNQENHLPPQQRECRSLQAPSYSWTLCYHDYSSICSGKIFFAGVSHTNCLVDFTEVWNYMWQSSCKNWQSLYSIATFKFELPFRAGSYALRWSIKCLCIHQAHEPRPLQKFNNPVLQTHWCAQPTWQNKLFLCHMNQLKTTISTMKLMVSRCQYIIMIN